MSSDRSRIDGDDLKALSAATYAASADHFDDAPLSFWDRFGRETVARARLRAGDQVVDACCGTGASALPAAHAVGPTGRVLGLDVSEPALARARAKVVAQGLRNVEFRAVDVEHTGLPSGSYDAVVCVFGIFFLPDMVAGLAELWRLVRPGGTLAITIWGPDFVEPAATMLWDAIGAERTDLVRAFQPWTRITDAAGLSAVFRDAGVVEPAVVAEPGMHALADADDFWTIVIGSGLRANVRKLDAAALERVRTATVAALRAAQVRDLQVNVVYAQAQRPA